MITKDKIEEIKKLRLSGYSQNEIAKKLKISRSTVQRHCEGNRLKLEDVFIWGKCKNCNTLFPKPKFMHDWYCPACNTWHYWITPWFKKDNSWIVTIFIISYSLIS